MNLRKFIRALQAQVKAGKTEIIFSQDEEGNAYMDKYMTGEKDKETLIIFPYNYLED